MIVKMIKNLENKMEKMQESINKDLEELEKEMATHSSILAWRIPWMEELGGLQSTGRKESDTTERLHFHFHSIKGFNFLHILANICYF